MKKKITSLAIFGLLAGTASAQVFPAVNVDYTLYGTVENTGVAVCPYYQWNAAVYDDPINGVYFIEWRDPVTGAQLDIDKQLGQNPDVAYYANADNVNVAYELGGNVMLDDYYLMTVSPTNYYLNANNVVAPGSNPNVDINSLGDGVLTWENAGVVYFCRFSVGPFAIVGPIVPVAPGSEPDIALLDNGKDILVTYVQGGNLRINSYDFNTLAPTGAWGHSPTGLGYSAPRIQGNRNQLSGPVEAYTVVAQDFQGGGFYNVDAYFHIGLGGLVGTTQANAGVSCSPSLPRPVVSYQHDQVHIAWSQNYACAPIISPPSLRDVLLVNYDYSGNHAAASNTPSPGMFEEVNNTPLNFTFSATSINNEYDGNYTVNPGVFSEGLVFTHPARCFWKNRNSIAPNAFRGEGTGNLTVDVNKGVIENMITVEVSTLDETITANDIEMEFALYDQSGRLVELPMFTQEGMVFQIDATTLEHGIYLLHYTLNGETEAVRIPHFTN